MKGTSKPVALGGMKLAVVCTVWQIGQSGIPCFGACLPAGPCSCTRPVAVQSTSGWPKSCSSAALSLGGANSVA